MATTKVINDLIDLNQTGNTTALKGCVGTTAQIPISSNIDIEYLVVAGGGGGGWVGGGGGAGGLLTNYGGTKLSTPTKTNVNVIIGIGGLASTNGGSAGTPSGNVGGNGSNSTFSTIISTGGGGGGSHPSTPAASGGSGGGAPSTGNSSPGASASPSGQGNAGGNNAVGGPGYGAGGGGGAGAVGVAGTTTTGGNGGVGLQNNITGTNTYYAGGGGGAVQDGVNNPPTNVAGTGGLGGGANASNNGAVVPTPASSNTGGGGGGGGTSKNGTGYWIYGNGSDGGSGTVTLRYPTANTLTSSATLLGNYSTGTTGVCSYPTTATALYQLNSGVGSNVPDTCGNYDGTANSITYVAGKFGNAAVFNGSSSYIETPSIIPANNFTFSCWVNMNSLPASNDYQIIYNTNVDRRWYLTIFDGGKIQAWNGNSEFTTASSVITTGQWYNITYTANSTTGKKIYLNGVEVFTTGDVIDNDVPSSGNAWKGFGKYLSNSLYFDGKLDQVRIFPSALTQAQVVALYAETTTPTTGTIGTDTWSQFISGTGTVSFSSNDGPQEGMLRTNTDLTSSGSASAMQFYKTSSPSGWVTLTNTANSSLGNVNFPTTNNGVGLFQLNGNLDNTAGGAASIYAGSSAFSSTSKYGSQSFNFNGSTSIDTGIAVTNSFTVSYWVYRNNTNFQYFYGTCDSNLLNGYLIGSVNPAGNGKLDFVVRNPSYTQTNIARAQGGTIPNNGQWYNITLTHSGSGTVGVTGVNTLYLNGSLVSNTLTGEAYPTGNPIAGTPSNPNNHIFGGAGVYTYERANSLFDQIRIYNTDLTSTQVGQLANET